MSDECPIGALIKQIHDAILKSANNSLRNEDLTLTQGGFLATLFDAPDHEMTLKELEKNRHVSQPTAHGVVKRLTEKKLVETFDDKTRKNIKHVRLTPTGVRRVAKARAQIAETEKRLTRNLTDKEMCQFQKILKKISLGLETT